MSTDRVRSSFRTGFKTHFTLATFRFNKEANRMERLPDGQVEEKTSFLVLHEGKLVFDGSTHDLVHSEDPFIQEYLR